MPPMSNSWYGSGCAILSVNIDPEARRCIQWRKNGAQPTWHVRVGKGDGLAELKHSAHVPKEKALHRRNVDDTGSASSCE